MVLPKLSNIRDSFPNYSSVPLRERKRTYLALPLGCETLGGSGVELETSVGCMQLPRGEIESFQKRCEGNGEPEIRVR